MRKYNEQEAEAAVARSRLRQKLYHEENKAKRNARTRAWRLANKEKAREYDRVRYQRYKTSRLASGRRYHQKLRTAAYTALGGRCAWCGNTDHAVLDLDHINGGGKKERGCSARQRIYRAVRDGGRTDIRLLCRSCNWRAHLKLGPPVQKFSTVPSSAEVVPSWWD